MRILLAIVLVIGLATPPGAQEPPNPEIERTVQGQIEAFLRDDFVGAFAFASPNIQRFFGNSQNFGAMVRQGYPMVWRPADVQFLEIRKQDLQILQYVLIQDATGVFHVLEYQMVENAGVWQISGVRIIERPEVST